MSRHLFVVGRNDEHARVTFSAREPVQYDRTPNVGDEIPSDRIEPGWGNGVLDSYRSKLPTPNEQYGDALVISILRRIAETHAKLAEDCRKLADALREDGAA